MASSAPNLLDRPPAGAEIAWPARMGRRFMLWIDTEEEFDWSQPFSRNNIGATSIHNQPLAHRVFERYGIVPSYLVDYPVATSEFAAVLRELRRQGACEIGAQLHPWVNPPHEEEVNVRHSYPGNLPADCGFFGEGAPLHWETPFGTDPDPAARLYPLEGSGGRLMSARASATR